MKTTDIEYVFVFINTLCNQGPRVCVFLVAILLKQIATNLVCNAYVCL